MQGTDYNQHENFVMILDDRTTERITGRGQMITTRTIFILVPAALEAAAGQEICNTTGRLLILRLEMRYRF